jgi:hypothetical protein
LHAHAANLGSGASLVKLHNRKTGLPLRPENGQTFEMIAAAQRKMATSLPSSRFLRLGKKITQVTEMLMVGKKFATLHIDANGNLTNDGNGKTYAYDAANRLISITQASGVTGFVYK